MARKKGKDRDSRGALLDAAWRILQENGTGSMSVDSVVAGAELSKGTFFHFFPTKQHLLDELCSRIADESWKDAASVLERTELDPIARLDLFLQAIRAWRSERSRALGGLWHELAREENAALLNKVSALGVEMLAPTMARLLAEANEQGLTQVADVEVVARLLVEWLSATAAGSMRLFLAQPDAKTVEIVLRRVDSTLAAIERVIGRPAGRFARPDREQVMKVVTAVVPEKNRSSAAMESGGRKTNPGRTRSTGAGASGKPKRATREARPHANAKRVRRS